jgi:hypothetical protein
MKIANICFDSVAQLKYWNDSNKSKFESGGNEKEIECG